MEIFISAPFGNYIQPKKCIPVTGTWTLESRGNLTIKQQDDAEEPTVEAPQQETPKPSFKFDDTNPAIYGEDLDVPAFIRRQQD